jgi:hypothetical protein
VTGARPPEAKVVASSSKIIVFLAACIGLYEVFKAAVITVQLIVPPQDS